MDQAETAQKQVQALKQLKQVVEEWEQVDQQLQDIQVILELIAEEPDAGLEQELIHGVSKLMKR